MFLLRRWFLLWLLMFWLGGFTFYAAVVVPIGTDVLGSSLQQGAITRQVTNWLNLAGAATLGAWAVELVVSPAPTPLRQRLRWLSWCVMAVPLLALIVLHPLMAGLLDAPVLDKDTFRTLHRWYLWLSTVQWAAGLLLSFMTLQTWRDADQRFGERERPGR
jgi:hypothetical protein